MGDEQVKEFLLDLGVEKDLVGDVAESELFVYVSDEPVLADQQVKRTERDHIFTFELASFPHTVLVGLLIAEFSEVLNERDEDIFGIVFLEVYLVRMFLFFNFRRGTA